MRRFAREQSLSLVFLALFLAALAGQAVAGWHEYNNDETWHALMANETPQTLSLGRYLTIVELRPGRDRELAVGVPAVHALHPAHGLVHPEGLAGVQAARGGGRRDRRAAVAGRAPAAGLAELGEGRRLAAGDLLELARAGDGDDLDLVLVRPVGVGLERAQRRAARARAARALLGRLPRLGRASGRRRCRTGSRSSSPSARWRCSRSTCASAARRSPSRSAAPTTPRPWRGTGARTDAHGPPARHLQR